MNLSLEFGANTRPLEQGIADVLSRLRQLIVGTDRATQATNTNTQAIGRAAQATNTYRDAQGRLRDERGRFVGDGSRFNGSLDETITRLSSLAVGTFSVNKAFDYLRQGLRITSDFQRLEASLKAVSKNEEDFGRSMTFLQVTSDQLGLSYESLASSYKSLKAASNGTALEGAATERIFTAVTKASAALQLSSEDTKGALNALQQMLSKGVVSAEELRQQLGERVPGAFKLFAEGLGVSEVKLNKMLEQGEILSDVALPKFAEALERTYGDKAQANVDNMAGSFQPLKDQASFLVAELSKTTGVDTFFTKLSNGLADVTRGFRELIATGTTKAVIGSLALPGVSGFNMAEAIATGKTKDKVTAENLAFRQAAPDRRQELIQTQSDIVGNIRGEYLGLIGRDSQTKVKSEELLKVEKAFREEKTKLIALRNIDNRLIKEEAAAAELAAKKQKELSDLNTKKGKAVQLLDISDQAIFQRALDNVLKTDPENVEKIANLRALIKDARSLEGGRRMLFEVPVMKSIGSGNVGMVNAISAPKLGGLTTAVNQGIRENGFDPYARALQYKLAAGEVTKALDPSQYESAINRFNDLIGTGLDVESAKNKMLAIQDVFRNIPDEFTGIKASLDAALTDYDPFSGLADKTMQSAEMLKQAFISARQQASSGAGDMLFGIGESIGKGKNPLKAALKGVFGLISDYLANTGKAMLLASGFLSAGFLTAPFGIQMATQGGAMLLGAGVIKGLANNIPAMAEGGFLTGPRVVLAGEAGNEAILPVDKIVPLMGAAMKTINPALAAPLVSPVTPGSVPAPATADYQRRNISIDQRISVEAGEARISGLDLLIPLMPRLASAYKDMTGQSLFG